MHVRLHQLRNDVDVLITGHCRRFGDVNDLDDVLVVKELEQLNLTNDSLGIDEVLKSFWNFLDGDLAVCNMIVRTADNTVGTVTDLLDVFKFLVDTESST